MKWIALAAAGMLMLVIPVFAQDATPEPSAESTAGLPACSDDLRAEIEDFISFTMVAAQLAMEMSSDENALDLINDVTVQQRAFWNQVDIWLQDGTCAEIYTRAYHYGRVLDEYSVGLGMGMAAIVAQEMGETRLQSRFNDQLEKHLRNAVRINEDAFLTVP